MSNDCLIKSVVLVWRHNGRMCCRHAPRSVERGSLERHARPAAPSPSSWNNSEVRGSVLRNQRIVSEAKPRRVAATSLLCALHLVLPLPSRLKQCWVKLQSCFDLLWVVVREIHNKYTTIHNKLHVRNEQIFTCVRKILRVFFRAF